LNDSIPAKPVIEWDESEDPGSTLRMRLPDGKQPWLWSIQTRRGDQWRLQVAPGQQDRVALDRSETLAPLEQVAVTAVSRTGVAGPGVTITIED
jgi:hypothetical protein